MSFNCNFFLYAHDATLPTAVTNQTNHLDSEMQMCKINEFNHELHVIKVADIN